MLACPKSRFLSCGLGSQRTRDVWLLLATSSGGSLNHCFTLTAKPLCSTLGSPLLSPETCHVPALVRRYSVVRYEWSSWLTNATATRCPSPFTKRVSVIER